ncbi:MAG: hypothetical protein JWM83_3206, partial [Candidatus Angelobacter sp.]|nr:hypothetical protein [Candidatus Angelobacter sp.]
ALKKLITVFAFVCLAIGFSMDARAQNLTNVSASNITDINGTKLAAGQLCFLITDQQDNPISVSIGGGGQALKRGYCSAVAAGVVTSFTVPNPASTLPSGIYYRVTVKDSSTGQEVLRYTGVSFTGATFNFDNYAPVNLGSFAPLTGNSVSGNLSVTGNVAATGTVTGSNIPSSILQQIFSAGIGQTQRAGVNFFSGILCSDNSGTSRTDCRPGTFNAVTFSATPTFDCSLGSVQKLTLTGNVTSSSLANCQVGQLVAFEICQDATGGRTFANPAGLNQWSALPIAANACAVQQYSFDALNVGFPDMMPALTGDVTSSATSTVTTVAKVNGVSYPSGPATHSVPVTTAANTETYKIIPDCTDATGNHINYTQSTDTFSCGVSVPANTVTTTATQTLSAKTLASPGFTGTETGMSITSPAISDPTITGNTNVKRIKANQGSSLVVGDVGGLSAGWGSTASVSSVAGNDVIGQINITSNGTGQAVNATFTLTFHDGTWTTAPLCLVVRSDGNGPSGAMVPNAMTATAATFFLNALPVAGTTYSATFMCVGR